MTKVKLTMDEARAKGMPEWMVERIETRCTQGCEHWEGRCNAGIMCHISLDKLKKPMGEITYHMSINFWLTMQMIRIGEKPVC